MPEVNLPSPGLLVTCLAAAVRLAPTGWKSYHRTLLLRRSIPETDATVVPDGLESAWAAPAEIRHMDSHPEASSRGAYRRRMERGDVCLCLKRGGEVVAYQWIARKWSCILCGFGPRREIRFLPLGERQVFTYDAFVYSAHRRRGLGRLLRKLLHNALRAQGIEEIFSLVAPENEPALKLNLSFGDEAICVAYGFRVRQWSKMILGPSHEPQLRMWVENFKSRSGLGVQGRSITDA